MQGDNAKLKQYLLGTLPESEMEELDLRIMSDRAFAEVLSLAEHELIEDHLEGSLTAEETALFQSDFLVSPKRRAMIREISFLKEFAKKKAQTVERAEPLASPSARNGFFGFYFRPIMAGAVLVAALAICAVWFGYLGENRSSLELEYARHNTSDLSDLSKLANYSAINLSSGNFRDSASTSGQSADKLTDTVLFRLALPPKTLDGSVFNAKIQRAGMPDFLLNDVPSYRNPNGHELRILVPKAILQKGRYQIIVESNAVDATVGTYVFIIE